MVVPDTILDGLAEHFLKRGLGVKHLIPLLESAKFESFEDGAYLFEQFHPAETFYLVINGAAQQVTASASRTTVVHYARLDWQYAALGWSGFMPPQRYGSTVAAIGSMTVLSWPHSRLAHMFYADPVLSSYFFDLVLDSVSSQLLQLRQRHLDTHGAHVSPPQVMPLEARRPVVGRADSCLRRSAFFAQFDEAIIETLAAQAELLSFAPGEKIAEQDTVTGGLLLLASGRCEICFEQRNADEAKLLLYRRLHNRNGVVAGIPVASDDYVAEASVYADTHCWVYRLGTTSLREAMAADPEFARSFRQRLLTRLAGLLGALQVDRNAEDAEPEQALVSSIIANAQARIPVTSDLFKVPHLLSHRLTISNALAVLHNVAQTGSYSEQLLATRCQEGIAPLSAENGFYLEIVAACNTVIASGDSEPADVIRGRCDEQVTAAFEHLDCRIIGEENLPARGGNVFVLNHLACPEYYQLPNGYHFSFDTGFVSCIVWRHFQRSPLRVIRESPGGEFGHNLFYKNLGHIGVPTLESDLEHLDNQEFAKRRRAASQAFSRKGRQLLEAGENLLICPEGQSQPVERSPARLHTGAFRLALENDAPIVPVALAGFHRRFKDGPLVAIIGEPVDVATRLTSDTPQAIREFVDRFRDELAAQVRSALEIASSNR